MLLSLLKITLCCPLSLSPLVPVWPLILEKCTGLHVRVNNIYSPMTCRSLLVLFFCVVLSRCKVFPSGRHFGSVLWASKKIPWRGSQRETSKTHDLHIRSCKPNAPRAQADEFSKGSCYSRPWRRLGASANCCIKSDLSQKARDLSGYMTSLQLLHSLTLFDRQI